MKAIKRVSSYYVSSFQGLRREVWILAAITLVNRAGSMVIPFLSLYLTADMGLDLKQVGWIMACFGAGSVAGSWLGGKLTDLLGFYYIVFATLFGSGLAFIGLQWVDGYTNFCIAVFFVSLVVDAFRPAMFVALRHYAKPENRTRGVTLVRLAINLGFSAGPAIGGLIIATGSYAGLFWVDGVTCMGAAILLLFLLKPLSAVEEEEEKKNFGARKPMKDLPFLLALLGMFFIEIPFLQYFSSIPLFYRDAHELSELTIGFIMGMNGLLIFILEMPLIKSCEDKGYSIFGILRYSAVLIGMSFLVLLLTDNVLIVWIGMIIVTIGEMLNFPFMNRFVYDRADHGKPGAYMGLYTITWSIAAIFGHTLGLNLVDLYGFNWTWGIFGSMVGLGVLILVLAERSLEAETASN